MIILSFLGGALTGTVIGMAILTYHRRSADDAEILETKNPETISERREKAKIIQSLPSPEGINTLGDFFKKMNSK